MSCVRVGLGVFGGLVLRMGMLEYDRDYAVYAVPYAQA